MAITLVGTGTVEAEANQPVTGSVAVQVGDFFLASIYIKNTVTSSSYFGGPFVNAPASTASVGALTTLLNDRDTLNSFRCEIAIGYGVVTSGGNLTIATAGGNSRNRVFNLSVFRGVNTDSPIVASSVLRGATTTTPTGTNVTPGKVGDWIVSCLGWGSASGSTLTPTASWTQIAEAEYGGYFCGFGVERFEAVDITARSGAPTLGTTNPYVMANIVLNAAPEVVPGTTRARGLYL